MAKHRLIPVQGIPQASDYGVSRGVIEAWRLRAILGIATRHAACDCESYQRHDSLKRQPPGWNLDRCPGPLATIHVERRRADEMTTRALMERCPWLSYHDAKAMARWQPGQPLPSTHGQHT